MKITKLIAAVIGVPMVVGSFALAVGGGIAIAVPDDNGWVSTGPVRMTTDAVALVAEDIDIDLGDHFSDGRTFIGWEAFPARLEAETRSDKSVFVGIASESDARAYLSEVATARVLSFGEDPTIRHRAGTSSVTPPGQSDIWVASSVDGTLEWDVSDGDWAIVVLNSDGTAGVDVAVTGSARVPFLTAIGVGLIAIGLIGMTAGVLLTYYGVRRVRNPQHNAPIPTASGPVAAG